MRSFNFLAACLLTLSLAACQQPPNNSGSGSGPGVGGAETQKPDGSLLGPPPQDGKNMTYQAGYMANLDQLIGGAWVSQCYPRGYAPHIPFSGQLPFYRMIYHFDHQNRTVAHIVREYNDPLCEENFTGPINPNTNDTMMVKGHYTIMDTDATFPNVVNVHFTWRACNSMTCQPYQDPINRIYLMQTRVAALRQANDGRQVLFWGANVGNPYQGATGQAFRLEIPFFRINFQNNSY